MKGTSRSGRKIFLERITPLHKKALIRRKRQIVKTNEVLILGTDLVPIQIHNDKLGDFAKQTEDPIDNLAESKAMIYDHPKLIYNQNYSSYNRQGRVVGGEGNILKLSKLCVSINLYCFSVFVFSKKKKTVKMVNGAGK